MSFRCAYTHDGMTHPEKEMRTETLGDRLRSAGGCGIIFVLREPGSNPVPSLVSPPRENYHFEHGWTERRQCILDALSRRLSNPVCGRTSRGRRRATHSFCFGILKEVVYEVFVSMDCLIGVVWSFCNYSSPYTGIKLGTHPSERGGSLLSSLPYGSNKRGGDFIPSNSDSPESNRSSVP